MDKTPARLLIETVRTDPDGAVTRERTLCGARIGWSGEAPLLRWRQTGEDGETAYALRVHGGGAKMRRTGQTDGLLRFVPGERTEGRYDTPYGSLLFEIETSRVSLEETETGGRIALAYRLLSGGAENAAVEMTLTWTY